MKIVKVLGSTLLASMFTVTTVHSAQATTAEQSEATSNQQTILFDNSHGQTAGAADWVIDGGFSDYADSMKSQGYQVKELDGQANINDDSLSGAKTLVIPEANIPFKATEQQALVNYVKNGGNVIFISDHYNADRNLNRIDSSEAMNGYRRGAYNDMTKDMSSGEKNSKAMQGVQSSDWLSQNFGVKFRYNALGNLNTQNIESSENSFGITKGVNSISMHSGSTLAITDPEKAKGIVYMPENLSSSQKWSHSVDQGIYNGGGKKEGPYVAVSKLGKGKAAFVGDSSMVEDSSPKYKREDNGSSKKTYDGFKEQDNGQLLKNITEWFGKSDDATSIKDSGVKLDEKTPLLDFEQPENSTEPQKEPWSQPEEGYKWYDRSTFKPGSYGSEQQSGGDNTSDNGGSGDSDNGGTSDAPSTSGDASFVLPQNVQPNEPFKVTVKLSGFEKNTTVNDLSVGIYKDGGQQIGSFSNDGSSFGNPGYSDKQSVKTDDNGTATLTLTAKVSDDLSGANIRLKQGSKAIATQSLD